MSLGVFVAPYVTYIATNVVIGVGMCIVLYNHIQILPYHRHNINMFRAGIFTIIVWMEFSSVIWGAYQAYTLSPACMRATV